MTAGDSHELSLEMAEFHEQSVQAAAANFFFLCTRLHFNTSKHGRGANLTLFHLAVTPNTAPIGGMEHPAVTEVYSPRLAAPQERAAPAP